MCSDLVHLTDQLDDSQLIDPVGSVHSSALVS